MAPCMNDGKLGIIRKQSVFPSAFMNAPLEPVVFRMSWMYRPFNSATEKAPIFCKNRDGF